VTIGLIALNAAVFLRLLLLRSGPQQETILRLALVPHDLATVPAGRPDLLAYNLMTMVTSMFLHAGWLHLISNMLYLWIFGNNIEDIMGHGRFVIFYLLCGLAGAAAQVIANPSSAVPMVGASGAIAGVLGAYVVMFPAARVHTLIFLVIYIRVLEIPALIVIGVWLLIQLINASQMGPGGVAWFAHLGGFLAGLVLVVPFRRRRVRQSLY